VSRTVLVTGAGGFAGGHLLEYLAPRGLVTAWSRRTPPSAVAHLGTWEQVDLLDRDAVRDAIRRLAPDHVYHCAGSPHVSTSWADTTTPLKTNVLGTHHLLDALRRTARGARVLIPGSSTVYASSDALLTEDHPVHPGSPYALTKLAQEQLGLRAIAEDGVDVIATRSFNHTGPRQSADFVAPSFASQIATLERGETEPVIKVGNLDARRDFTDVRDVVRAYVALMADGEPGTIYNVASGLAHSMRSILDGLVARARVPVRVEVDPERLRPNDTPSLAGDASRLHAATGWQPEIPFERMLDDLLDFWRAAQ